MKSRPRRTWWHRAMCVPVIRGNGQWPETDLEPGVKFFVLALEQLGCTTRFSCEGHPDGFYIVFAGPLPVAQQVAWLGCFSVTLSGFEYRLGLTGQELFSLRHDQDTGGWNAARKEALLVAAARRWTKAFGPVQAILAVERRKGRNRRVVHEPAGPAEGV